MNCSQPGCSGQVVDGYCDLCGMAPPRAASKAPVVAGVTTAPPSRQSQLPAVSSTLTATSLTAAR